MLLVEDALYANAPHLRQVSESGWHDILNVKPDSHKSLFKQFEWRKQGGAINSVEQIGEGGERRRFRWTENLFLCQSAADVKVNFLWYEETDKPGKTTRWTWVTSLPTGAPDS